ncbi:hypothetical protein SAMN04488074_10232 [Lentzea albidocapillata subsp. violacea]|uniref:ARB-07466-like C-terminal domain-containing protein n=1 Tax=Lentzea albidocapillata subsp. violacea TaxID=128104 RepID=A0A1G8TMB4_9PSEU|nr:hypothetical protein [Lentzea albidocapillata]SDJ42587.1 hypothetical protein SAMN04488074_10232 [Lentzea albidocapillata subsp. violacea]
MPGRHRTKQTASRKLPIAVAATLTAGLVVTFWAVRDQPIDPTGAAAQLAAPSIPVSQDPRPVTTTAPPSSEPPATTTPPPVTTTAPTTTTPPPAPPPPPPCPTTLDGVKPHVAQVGHHLAGKFGVDDIGGAAGRGGSGDHPSGLALDFMVDTATGNALADHVLANRRAFGVTYVIWRQRYNDGSGWSAMEDRGSPTANHMDHVHVSFQANATVNVTC